MKEFDLNKLSNKDYFNSLTIEDLNIYADLLRDYLIKECSKKSTHLASNLGTIEIFLALNKVFDFSKDLLVFDVGHQIYTYKILTGRFEKFPTLREFNGLSGFPDPDESKHDLFKVGHVGCALPLALGLSTALTDNKKEKDNDEKDKKTDATRQIISLIGDGALTNGPTLEALNYISNRKDGKIIIILNDNGMSISRTIPNIIKKFSLFATKLNIRGSLEEKLKKKGYSAAIGRLVKFIKYLKNLILPEQIFEDFGIRYVGPINGHNIKELIDYFTFAKNFPQTILVHVKTIKGKGFKPAEENPELFHSAPPYNPVTGEVKESPLTFTNIFGNLLAEKGMENENIFAITAAMRTGCGLDIFEKKFPKRFIDAGIAESLAVSMGAGLAKAGKNPVVAIYSIFLQRAASQIYHDVVLNHLPVFFAIDRSGLVGIDGPTHHGLYIYPFLASLPDCIIINCGFIEDIRFALSLLGNQKLPIFMLYPKDIAISYENCIKEIYDKRYEINNKLNRKKGFNEYKIEYKPSSITEFYRDKGNILAVIAVGSSFNISEKALMRLFNENLSFDLYYMSQIKPFPVESSIEIIERYKNIIIVDEAASISYVFQEFSKISSKLKIEGKFASNILSFTLPDRIIPHGTREQLFNLVEFSDKHLFDMAIKIIKNDEKINIR